MKHLFIVALVAILFQPKTFAQYYSDPCGCVTVDVIAPNPQTGIHNYFGVKVSLAASQNRNIVVTGYIHDEGDANTNTPFTITVLEGYLSNQTSETYYETDATATGGLTITSVTHAPCYNDPVKFDAKFNNAGQFHNEAMMNIMETFVENAELDVDEAMTEIMNCNKEFYMDHELEFFGDVSSSLVTDDNFNTSRTMVNKDEFAGDLLSSSGSHSLATVDYFADTTTRMDAANKALFARITSVLRDNLEGGLSNSEYTDSLIAMENDWLDLNECNETAVGEDITGYILTIGTQSALFWQSHLDSLWDSEVEIAYLQNSNTSFKGGPSYLSQRLVYFPAWLGIDIGGAIFGEIMGFISGKSAKECGKQALVSAVGASTGASKRIWNFIKSIF